MREAHHQGKCFGKRVGCPVAGPDSSSALRLVLHRARDPDHAAELYRAGATDAVPETVESSLQLSEAVLVDIGVPMGPVIASVHKKRAQLRDAIMDMSELDTPRQLPREKLRKT